MPQYLNQELSFDEVRWSTMRKTSYDSLRSFRGAPQKVLLPAGTTLYRLVPMANANSFEGVWWMPKAVWDELRNDANRSSHGSGRLLRNYVAQYMALPSGSYQLSVVEIELVQPVYAWSGDSAGLFDRLGGMLQIYLPNLPERGDPTKSLFARTVRTFWIKF